MTRIGLTEKILDIKREKGWSWKHICKEIGGYSEFLIVGALLGQMKLTKPQAAKAGVAKAIDILQKELSVAMALTGTTRVADIGPQVLVSGPGKAPARKRKE